MTPLKELLTPTNFCVVGNSPKEMGTCNGSKIDSFDHVIRFKNYITDGYEVDYGVKTTIWATPFNLTQFYRDPAQYQAILCSLPIQAGAKWRKFYGPQNIDYPLMKRYNSLVEFMPEDWFEEGKAQYPSGQLSTGMNILYWIYKLVGHINQDQIFGFSLFDPKEDHHYFLKEEMDPKKNPQTDPRRQRIQKQWFGGTQKTHPPKFERKLFDLITFSQEND